MCLTWSILLLELKKKLTKFKLLTRIYKPWEPAVTTTETETPEGVDVEHTINLDDENVKIAGGSG